MTTTYESAKLEILAIDVEIARRERSISVYQKRLASLIANSARSELITCTEMMCKKLSNRVRNLYEKRREHELFCIHYPQLNLFTNEKA